MTMYLLNSPVICHEERGVYLMSFKIDIETARKLIERAKRFKEPVVSAIGHQATADLLTKLLGTKIEMNRIMVTLKPYDSIIAFRLKQRLPEGKVIENEEELERIGYEMYFIIATGTAGTLTALDIYSAIKHVERW